MNRLMPLSLSLLFAVAISVGGCGKSDGPRKTVLQNKGSDTMVNLAIIWAEEYRKERPDVSIEVSGGGSGTGIAALIKGTVDIANASRNMKPQEIEQAKKNTGKDIKEIIVGYDALAVYVHKDNPLNEITFQQLKKIYVENGSFTKWSQLGVDVPGCSGEIIRISRQSNAGTYEFFREHVLDEEDFKLGSRDMNGSKEVVELVSSTPCSIGYSGMGYATEEVKMLKVSKAEGETAHAPTLENTLQGLYPIARSLQMYTLGEPQGAIKEYIDWCLSNSGQAFVQESGYVPLQAKSASP